MHTTLSPSSKSVDASYVRTYGAFIVILDATVQARGLRGRLSSLAYEVMIIYGEDLRGKFKH
jgi:hypothetical protein